MKKRLNKKKVFGVLIILIVSCSVFYYNLQKDKITNEDNTKIFLIGLDGATWDVMMPLVEQGKLPNMQRLMNNGVYGNLTTISMTPILSSVAWTSLATGKIPEKHGIRSWDVTRLSIKSKTVWDILEENGKKIGLLNYLITWPPRKINGFMVPGWARLDSTTYPPELYEELKKESQEEEIREYYIKKYENSSYLFKNFACWDFWRTDYRANQTLYLMDKYETDFFATTFYGPDSLQMFFWQFIEPELFNVSQEELKKHKEVIPSYYQKFDGIIGKITSKLDENTIVIIASDHGFKVLNPSHRQIRLYALSFLEKMDLLKRGESIDMEGFDLSQSKAYALVKSAPDEMQILINKEIVKGEYDTIKNYIIETLENITITGTDIKILKLSYEDDQKFEIGFNLINKNNLSYDTNITFLNEDCPLIWFTRIEEKTGQHAVNGILIMSGKKLNKNKLIKNASIIDVAPTILYLMNIPIPIDMDGKVLVDAINPGYIKDYPIIKTNIKTDLNIDKEETARLEEQAKTNEEYREKLRSLGYIN